MSIDGADLAQDALGRVLRSALDRLGPAALGAVVLPDIDAGPVGANALRTAGALLWAAQLEEAALLPFVEALAEQIATGRLAVMMERGADLLSRYWRNRAERHTAAERRALFSRLFGGPGDPAPHEAFPAAWDALLQAILAAEANPQSAQHRAKVGAAAQAVAIPLSQRATGSARYDADRILAHIDEAWRLLREPDIARAFGGQPPWTLVQLYGPELLGRRPNPTPAVARARAGLSVCTWLADEADAIQAGAPTVHPAVIEAAARWRGSG